MYKNHIKMKNLNVQKTRLLSTLDINCVDSLHRRAMFRSRKAARVLCSVNLVKADADPSLKIVVHYPK